MKTRSETFVFEQDGKWEPAGKNVVRQILGYDGLVGIEPGVVIDCFTPMRADFLHKQ